MNNDIATTVNNFMLNDAPTMYGSGHIQASILRLVIKHLLFTIKTNVEHAVFVMHKKYGDSISQSDIRELVLSVSKEYEMRTEAGSGSKRHNYDYIQPSLL